MGDLDVEVALHLRAEHAEGPIWDAVTARLWWVDITGERVHCLEPVSGAASSWPTHGQAGGVVIDTAGNPVVAAPDGLAVLDTTTGSITPCVAIEADKPENRANDAKVDTHGRVWVGTMAFDKSPGNAALYRVDGDTVTCVVDGLTISNGPAFDEAGGRMYLADTGLGIVDVFDFDPMTGRLGTRKRFLDFSDAGMWPDGMTIDDAGLLWIALGRAGRGPPVRQQGPNRRRSGPPDIKSHLRHLRWGGRWRSLHHDFVVRPRAGRPSRRAARRGDLSLPARRHRPAIAEIPAPGRCAGAVDSGPIGHRPAVSPIARTDSGVDPR